MQKIYTNTQIHLHRYTQVQKFFTCYDQEEEKVHVADTTANELDERHFVRPGCTKKKAKNEEEKNRI